MLSYESRPISLGSGHSKASQNGLINKMDTTMDSSSADHKSNGISQKASPQRHAKSKHRHIWLITGPAGCGKSTVAEYIAKSLNFPYIEGDNVCLAELQRACPTSPKINNTNEFAVPPSL
jgi:DNA polymerase III gamma/tau subunit